jgi:hypothetical protein
VDRATSGITVGDVDSGSLTVTLNVGHGDAAGDDGRPSAPISHPGAVFLEISG